MSRRRRPAFLTLDEVLALHADQIERYGGQYLLGSLPEMAAAYLL